MVRDGWKQTAPDVQIVLDTLDDSVCQSLLKELTSTKTVQELAETADVPRSTAYRKINQLEAASLVESFIEVRTDGHHTTRYRLAFEDVTFSLDANRELTVAITRPPDAPEDRLASLWNELRKET
ncbi:helix-turn-helix domain-containing protein [Haladaptatus sp. DJG-WS-42]|uniref:ArsR/SmtB family transcription factor n=1 Tax=Haladaptatus sp. DJG-WS-42 TaxID=3120516 RepID=UPI0030CDAD90